MSLLIIVVADLLDSTIHSEEYLSAVYDDVPLLAVIPPVNGDKNSYSSYNSYAAKTTQTEQKGRVKK